jgi:hypothetical protein
LSPRVVLAFLGGKSFFSLVGLLVLAGPQPRRRGWSGAGWRGARAVSEGGGDGGHLLGASPAIGIFRLVVRVLDSFSPGEDPSPFRRWPGWVRPARIHSFPPRLLGAGPAVGMRLRLLEFPDPGACNFVGSFMSPAGIV